MRHSTPARRAPPAAGHPSRRSLAASRLRRAAAAAASAGPGGPGSNGAPAAASRNLLESDADAALAHPPVPMGGMRRTPLSGGVQSATARHDLPSPAVAVRNLMEQARFAHLCTVMSRAHHRRAGFPFGSLVDFAVDEVGAPVLALSPLAVHCRNALSDPRCTLVVQMPGWGGLANARVTVFGELSPCEGPDGARAAALLAAKSATGGEGAGSVAGQFAHFRMSVLTDIYFVGGFGTVQWVDVDEYMAARPDPIVLSRSGSDGPQATLAALNAAFGLRLPRLLAGVDEAVLVSIDRGGADARVRRGDDLAVERLRFPAPVDSPAQAHAAVGAMLDAAAAGRGAAFVAAMRGVAARLPATRGVAPDDVSWRWAGARLPRLLAAWPRAISLLLRLVGYDRIAADMALRTRAFDGAVLDFLGAEGGGGAGGGGLGAPGCQLVLLGAGYDARAVRLADELNAAGCAVFEVDSPGTQLCKRVAVARLLAPSAPRAAVWRFAAVDFEFERPADMAPRLFAQGLDPSKRTLVLIEGVVPYLSEPAIGATLRAARALCGPGSRLALDEVPPALLRSRPWPGAAAILASLAFRLAAGERVRAAGWPDAEVGPYLAACGWPRLARLGPIGDSPEAARLPPRLLRNSMVLLARLVVAEAQ